MAEGEFALVRQHLDQADRVANDPVRWGSAVTELDYWVLYADAAARSRDRNALVRFAPLAEKASDALGHRLYRAIARRSIAVLAILDGHVSDALVKLEQALQEFEALGTRYQIGLTLADRADALAQAGDGAAARTTWQEAVAAFEAQGARPAAQRGRAALASLPGGPPAMTSAR